MNAFRWTLYALVCFAAGTGAAFALDPPAAGVPTSSASKIKENLDAIEQYARNGQCEAVQGRLQSTQSQIDDLPAETDEQLVRGLQRSLDRIASAARSQCNAVREQQAQEERERQQEQEQLQETTPAEPVQPTTPDPGGNEGGGPDPGTGEGTDPGPGDGGDGGTTPDGDVVVPGEIGQLGKEMRERAQQARRDGRAAAKEMRQALKEALQR